MADSKKEGRRYIGRRGTFRLMPVKRLDVFYEIQRKPTDQRLKELEARWEDERAGVFLVAKLTDGPYEGQHHITNGGTRFRTIEAMYADDLDKIVLPCHIAEMTMEEAAIEFLSENKDAKSPHFYYQYIVGLRAGEPVMIAIHDALDEVGIEAGKYSVYGSDNGVVGIMSSLKACERIVAMHVKMGDTHDEAALKLADVIERCRMAYPGDKSAHSADLIQAINRLIVLNPDKLNKSEGRARLIKTLAKSSVAAWNTQATNARKFGGSESRGTYMAYYIGREYNKRMSQSKKLVIPKFEVVEPPKQDDNGNGDDE